MTCKNCVPSRAIKEKMTKAKLSEERLRLQGELGNLCDTCRGK